MRRLETRMTLTEVPLDYQSKNGERVVNVNGYAYKVRNSRNLIRNSTQYRELLFGVQKIMPLYPEACRRISIKVEAIFRDGNF